MATDPELREIKLQPWTLTFSDPAFEQRFQASWLKATRRVDLFWSIGGFAFLALMAVSPPIFLPADHHEYLWVLYSVTLPAVALLQIPVFIPSRPKRLLLVSYFAGSFLVFGTMLFLFVMVHREHNIIFLFELAAAYVFCQHYNRVLFKHALAFSTIAGCATIVTIATAPGIVGITPFPAMVAVLGHGLAGVFAGYAREFFVRRNFLSLQILRLEAERNKELAREADAASDAKSRFLAVVSHELRSPLHAIIGFADTIQAGILGPVTNAKVRGAVVDIHSSGHHLLGIVDDILELSRANLGSLSLKEDTFDLEGLIGEAVTSFEAECARQNIELDVRLGSNLPPLFADRKLVRRMISNLLSNAIKYSDAEGRICVMAALADGGTLAIEIEDTGIGIAAEKLDSAMAVFGQADDGLDRRHEGLGIGLPLTRSLIELHGGSIEVSSVAGRGTRVRLTFPAERVAERPTSVPEATSAA